MVTALILAASAGSFELGNHGGLALVLEPDGTKHCVDRMAQFIGMPQGDSLVIVAYLMGLAWLPLLFGLACHTLLSWVRRRRRSGTGDPNV